MFKTYRPTIVWCDEHMPGMNGLAVAKAVRRYETDEKLAPCHFSILSGDSHEKNSDAVRALEDGTIDGWHVKGGGLTIKHLSDGLDAQSIELEERKLQLARLEALIARVRNGGIIPDALKLPKTP